MEALKVRIPVLILRDSTDIFSMPNVNSWKLDDHVYPETTEQREIFSKNIDGTDGKSWVLPLPFDDPIQPLYRGLPLPLCVLEAAGIQSDKDGTYENSNPDIMAKACRQMAGWKLSNNGNNVSHPMHSHAAAFAHIQTCAHSSLFLVRFLNLLLAVVAKEVRTQESLLVQSWPTLTLTPTRLLAHMLMLLCVLSAR